MNIHLPYDNNDLNVNYLLAKNQELNTTSSMIVVCFMFLGCLFYSLSDSIIGKYRNKQNKLIIIVKLLNKIHNLELDLSDLDAIIFDLEYELDKDSESHSESESESESESHSESDSELDKDINLSIRINETGRRVLRNNRNNETLHIKGKGWKLE